MPGSPWAPRRENSSASRTSRPFTFASWICIRIDLRDNIIDRSIDRQILKNVLLAREFFLLLLRSGKILLRFSKTTVWRIGKNSQTIAQIKFPKAKINVVGKMENIRKESLRRLYSRRCLVFINKLAVPGEFLFESINLTLNSQMGNPVEV